VWNQGSLPTSRDVEVGHRSRNRRTENSNGRSTNLERYYFGDSDLTSRRMMMMVMVMMVMAMATATTTTTTTTMTMTMMAMMMMMMMMMACALRVDSASRWPVLCTYDHLVTRCHMLANRYRFNDTKFYISVQPWFDFWSEVHLGRCIRLKH